MNYVCTEVPWTCTNLSKQPRLILRLPHYELTQREWTQINRFDEVAQQRPLHSDDVPAADFIAAWHSTQSFAAHYSIPRLLGKVRLDRMRALTWKQRADTQQTFGGVLLLSLRDLQWYLSWTDTLRDRWPLVRGMGGQAEDAKYNTPCTNTHDYYHQRYSHWIGRTCSVLIMHAIVIQPKINATYNRRGIVQYANTSSHVLAHHVFNINPVTRIPLAQDGTPVCYDTCRLRFAAPARQQALYTMCFIHTAQHLYSLVQTQT